MTDGATRREAELWATWRALTGDDLPEDAARLLDRFPDVAAATSPPLPTARVVERDRDGRPTVLAVEIVRHFERWSLVALLNWREGPVLAATQLDRCGLPTGGEWLAFDVWGRASLGIATHAVGRRLPGRACLALALRANLQRPQVVGTTEHLSCGAIELLDVAWHDDRLTLAGTASAGSRDLALMLRCPHPFEPLLAEGGELGALAEARVSLRLAASPSPRAWVVAFRRVVPLPPGHQRITFFD